MLDSKRVRRCAVVVAIAMGLFAFARLSTPVRAADHLEAPIVAQDLGADIADVYFFLDPNDNNFAVCAVTVHGFITPAQNANTGFFDGTVRFRFAFENTGDAKPDYFIDVTHSKQTSRTAPQTASIVIGPKAGILPLGRSFTAPTTISRAAFGPPGAPTFGGGTSAQQTSTVTTDPTTGVSYFGGLIDDPFFFDLGAELAYRASRIANQINPAILTRGRDSFSGYNVMVVDIRVPVALLKGSAGNKVGMTVFAQRKAYATFDPLNPGKDRTSGKYVNIDRMATPGVNTVLTSYGKKNLYNRSTPERDAVNADGLATDIVANLQALQTTAPFIGILANIAVTNGDYLRLDTSIPNTGTEGGKNAEAAFPNGRRPNDDVIDTIVTLINNGVFQGDAVNDNELVMRDAFPFFAQPHMPFPPGAGAEDLTRN
jgi:hypothetical protein